VTSTNTSRNWGVGSAPSSCGSTCAGSGSRGSAGGSTDTSTWPRRSPSWIDDAPDWERLAPVPFSTVCFRWDPGGLGGAELDARNTAIMDAVNRTGEVFLSHTRLAIRFTIRLSVGNLRTEPHHVERAWTLLRDAAAAA
jgi:aromatic-L-amino-acid decarboxylase